MKATDPNAKRVRRGARVLFRTLFGTTAEGIVYMRRGEHVGIHYGDGNDTALYLEDIFGVLSKRKSQPSGTGQETKK